MYKRKQNAKPRGAWHITYQKENIPAKHQVEEITSGEPQTEIMTPGKLLESISPVTPTVVNVKRRRRNIAAILNSVENIQKRKESNAGKKKIKTKQKSKQAKTKTMAKRMRKHKRTWSSSSSSATSEQVVLE